MGIATSQDVSDFDGSLTLPVNVDRWLTIASGLVADAVSLSVYVPDVNGLPASVPHQQAMRDAVSAQVAFWITAGADPTGAGDQAAAASVVSSKSLSPVGSVSYDTQAQREALAARAASTRYLCAEAWGILRRAGLSRTVVCG